MKVVYFKEERGEKDISTGENDDKFIAYSGDDRGSLRYGNL